MPCSAICNKLAAQAVAPFTVSGLCNMIAVLEAQFGSQVGRNALCSSMAPTAQNLGKLQARSTVRCERCAVRLDHAFSSDPCREEVSAP